jgi:hypothetical protein
MELEDGANLFNNDKFENDSKVHKRYVCAVVGGESEFIIDDYPKLFGEGSSDIWVIRETPAGHSATGKEDEGNGLFEHEAPANGSVFRFLGLNPARPTAKIPALKDMPPEQAKAAYEMVVDMHKSVGTHYIPTFEDVQKHVTMHKTESLNLFFCLNGGPISLNDEDEIFLEPGDAFIQLGSMHGWAMKQDDTEFGHIGGLLVDADLSTIEQLKSLPKPSGKSELNKFKRYVAGTKFSEDKEIGKSVTIIDDFSPNESELFDENNKLIGYAGEIWKTFDAKANLSGTEDAVTGPLDPNPPKNGITFRMVELLPGCKLPTNANVVNYYSVIKGAVNATDSKRAVNAKHGEHIVQLRAEMGLENVSDEPALMAHFMIDSVG